MEGGSWSVPKSRMNGQHDGVCDPVGVRSPVLVERNGKGVSEHDGQDVQSTSQQIAQESEESLETKITALTERNDRVDGQLKGMVAEMETDGPNHSIVAKGYLVSTLKAIIEEKERLLHLLKIEKCTNERVIQESTDAPSRKRKIDDDGDREAAQSTVTRVRALRGAHQDPGVRGNDSGATLSRRNDDNRENTWDVIDILLKQGSKPVILLYPLEQQEVSVRLELCPDWNFSALYPKPRHNKLLPRSSDHPGGENTSEWRVRASPDGSLLDLETQKVYPYLFWEAYSKDGRVTKKFGLKGTPSFCVAGGQAGDFLDDALTRLGLNMRERCDMITYWLPHLEAFPFNEIFFVDVQRYGETAKLDVSPRPDVVIRVFMVFRGVNTFDPELCRAELNDLQAPTREGFVVVEWGGMNLNGPAMTR